MLRSVLNKQYYLLIFKIIMERKQLTTKYKQCISAYLVLMPFKLVIFWQLSLQISNFDNFPYELVKLLQCFPYQFIFCKINYEKSMYASCHED